MKDITKGFLLGMVGVTILSVINDVAVTAGELLKAKMAVQINKYNTMICDPHQNTRVIGFAAPDDWEDEDDADE